MIAHAALLFESTNGGMIVALWVESPHCGLTVGWSMRTVSTADEFYFPPHKWKDVSTCDTTV